MKRKSLYDLAHVCTLVLVPGVTAWISGLPLIFPSLGPSAFALVLDENEDRAWRVIGGHLIGVVSGLLAYHLLAHGLSLAALAPALSADGLRVVASGVVSVGLTTAVMSAARANHAPACATTLHRLAWRVAGCRGRGPDDGRRDRHVPDAPPGDVDAEVTRCWRIVRKRILPAVVFLVSRVVLGAAFLRQVLPRCIGMPSSGILIADCRCRPSYTGILGRLIVTASSATTAVSRESLCWERGRLTTPVTFLLLLPRHGHCTPRPKK
jgi:hypothetical protein